MGFVMDLATSYGGLGWSKSIGCGTSLLLIFLGIRGFEITPWKSQAAKIGLEFYELRCSFFNRFVH